MTVAEAIEVLRTLPGDMELRIYSDYAVTEEWSPYWPVETLRVVHCDQLDSDIIEVR